MIESVMVLQSMCASQIGKRLRREIPEADLVVAGLTGHDYAKPGKPDIAWDTAPPGMNLSPNLSPTR